MIRAFFFSLVLLAGKAWSADVEGLPAVGPAPDLVLAQPQEKTLANGLRVIAVERPGLPLFHVRMLIKAGAEADPPRLAGLANFTAELLTSGTATRTATQLAQEIDALGARIETEAGWDFIAAKLTTLSAKAAPAFALLADAVRRPAFAPAEIERKRLLALDEMRLLLEEPSSVARIMARRAALNGLPYDHSAKGTPASLARLARPDLVALHRRAFRPENSFVVVAGNLPPEEVFRLVEESFGDWKGDRRQKPSAPLPISIPEPHAYLLDLPTAGQSAVFLAAPGIARSSEEYFIAKVCNAVLGGGYSSWLNQEVRVKRGLSYGASSAIDTWRSAGMFSASAQTKHTSAVEVVRVMQAEVQRLATEPVAADYLATRKAVLTGNFARDFETSEGHTKRLAELALYGLPLDLLNHFVERIEKVSAEEVSGFATRHLPASALSIIVAGPAEEIAPPLRELFPKLQVIPQAQLDLDSPTLRKPQKR